MNPVNSTIRIAIVGLGEAGEIFAEHLLEKIQLEHKPVKIVAPADPDVNSSVALGFSQNGVPVYPDSLDVLKHAEDIDIIFNLSGDPAISQRLRIELLHLRNSHTSIASEEIAQLLWCFFGEKRDLPKAEKRNFQLNWSKAIKT